MKVETINNFLFTVSAHNISSIILVTALLTLQMPKMLKYLSNYLFGYTNRSDVIFAYIGSAVFKVCLCNEWVRNDGNKASCNFN